MDDKIWKWILERLSNRSLLKLVNHGEFRIRGFRKLTDRTIPQARIKVIAEVVRGKNRVKLIEFFDYMAEVDEDKIRDITETELETRLLSGLIGPSATLAILLSSVDEEHRARAVGLFESIGAEQLEILDRSFDKGEGKGEGKRPLKPAESGSQEQGTMKKSLGKLLTKLEKSEAKNQELKKRLEEETKANQQLKRDHDEVAKEWRHEGIKQQQEMGRLNHVVEALNDRIKCLTEEKSELDAQLLKRQSEIDKLEETAATYDGTEVLGADEDVISVALIGNPKNPGIQKAAKYDFHIFEGEAIQTAVTETEFVNLDEVWVLTYRTPLGKQLLIRRNVEKDKLLEFQSFVALRNHIRKGT